ncbi:MAG: leucine-rich repeat protein [Bacteroidaceae bacterium]|nr:leucine-rich repeat protein [Bacteroidaceae bacterium]
MKKTLKLMLAFALVALSSTSAWAAGEIKGTYHQGSADGYKYKFLSVYGTPTATKVNTVAVAANVWASNGGTAIAIANTVDIPVKGVDDDGISIDKTLTFQIVEVGFSQGGTDQLFSNTTTGKSGNVTSISIGANVKKIWANAFAGCSNVTEVTFVSNNNALEIGAGAFAGTKIETLDLSPTKLTKVENLFGTSTIVGKVSSAPTTDAKIPAAATATVTNTYLKNATFPATLTEIDEGAFVNCTKLTYVNFTTPASTVAETTIGNYAFYGTAIQDLNLTNTVVKTLNPLFGYNNVTLRKVTLPASIETLADYALADQIQLGEGDAEVAQDHWDDSEYYVYPGGLSLATAATTWKVNAATDYYAKDALYQRNNLKTIGKYALSNTIIENVDLSNCWQLEFTGNPIFVSELTYTNSNLQTVKLPEVTELTTATAPANWTDMGAGKLNKGSIANLGLTFANCPALTTVTGLGKTAILTVTDYAFANDKALTELSFPATVTAITGRPFAGCAKLATLNIDATALITLGTANQNLFGVIDDVNDALGLTLPLSSDIWNTTGNVAPGAASATSALVNLTITNDLAATATINAGAFYADDSKLENLLLCHTYGVSGTVSDAAFKLNPAPADGKNTVKFGNINTSAVISATAASIDGPTEEGMATELFIGETYKNLTTNTFPFVSGNISSATVTGTVDAGLAVDIFGQAVVINFQKNITGTIQNNGLTNSALTTLNFDGGTGDYPGVTIADGIAAGTFVALTTGNAPNLKTVYWHPADPSPLASMTKFNQKTFADASQAIPAVTLYTTELVAYDATNGYDNSEANLYNVKFIVSSVTIDSQNIEVLAKSGANYYWGMFEAPAGKNWAIDIEQEIGGTAAKVAVYSAYVDENIIYVDPIAKNNGQYIVEAGEAVIVRSTVGDNAKDVLSKPVVATATEEYSTMRSIKTGATTYDILNDLEVNADLFSSDYIATQYAAGKVIYFMANPLNNNGLVFKYIRKTGYLPAGQLYLVKEYGSEGEIPSEASLRVVILGEDGTEDPTFINGVEVEETEATVAKGIYNLQGIRVNGAYKGIVIKDGKKFLQK